MVTKVELLQLFYVVFVLVRYMRLCMLFMPCDFIHSINQQNALIKIK